MCSQQRALQERFPWSPTAGWTSDFAKAFKQVAHLPFFIMLVVIAQWCPDEGMVHFWIPLSQLFGGRSSPQNFSRYPAWFCFELAMAFALSVQHCVDDMLGMDRLECVDIGWRAWRRFAAALGWDVPDAKSPLPSRSYVAVGYLMDHSATPWSHAKLTMAEARRDALMKYIRGYLSSRCLPGGEASSLFGRLGFGLNSAEGRFGRAMLRPIKRRQGERRSNLNRQLEASLNWWLKWLRRHVPRSIYVDLASWPVVVSYSDGEGSGDGGVAVWHPALPKPRAAFLQVPWMLRRLWALQSSRTFKGTDQRDIFEIEAIGPLLLLDLWPELFRSVLWLHFIDNSSAQAALARGSSTVESGDAIVGLTWERIVSLRCLPWFDRVASKSNPVDGLSRGQLQGPWGEVVRAEVPKGLLHRLRDELTASGVRVSGA